MSGTGQMVSNRPNVSSSGRSIQIYGQKNLHPGRSRKEKPNYSRCRDHYHENFFYSLNLSVEENYCIVKCTSRKVWAPVPVWPLEVRQKVEVEPGACELYTVVKLHTQYLLRIHATIVQINLLPSGFNRVLRARNFQWSLELSQLSGLAGSLVIRIHRLVSWSVTAVVSSL